MTFIGRILCYLFRNRLHCNGINCDNYIGRSWFRFRARQFARRESWIRNRSGWECPRCRLFAEIKIFQKQQEVYLECMRSIYEAHKYFRDNQYEFFPIKAFKTDNLEESRVAFEDCESQEFEPVIDTSLMVTSNFDVLYSHVNDSLGTDSSEKKVVPIRLNGKGSKRRTSWRSPRWEKSNSRSPPS